MTVVLSFHGLWVSAIVDSSETEDVVLSNLESEHLGFWGFFSEEGLLGFSLPRV